MKKKIVKPLKLPFHFQAPEYLHNQLNDIVSKTGKSKTRVLIEAIEIYINKFNKEHKNA